MKKRLEWIDLAKGIGIILMIIGHMPSIPSAVHNWIFSFHMPLFFFLSGYMFKKKKVIIPGIKYKLGVFACRFLTLSTKQKISYKIQNGKR